MPRAFQGHASGGVDLVGLAYLAILLAVIFAPVIFCRRARTDEPPESGSSDDGPGRGPRRRPPGPLSPPGGGLPLLDAEQSRRRLRDHRPAALRKRDRRRQQAHDPTRTPVRDQVP